MNYLQNKHNFKKFRKKIKPEDGSIHFIALGGIGMSALAKILLEYGYKVSGSDIKNNQILESLKEKGATVSIGHKAENIKGASLVVVSTAIKEDNPELIAANNNGIDVIHRSQLLEALLYGLGKVKKPVSIGVTGTHGKTTTTGMLTQVFNSAGENPSFAIGGKLPGVGTNSAAGEGNHFIAELDESDGSIELYTPDISIITNLEFDHADHYENGFEQILETFENFTSELAKSSRVIVNIDDSGNNKLLERIDFNNVITYALDSEEADYRAEVIETAPNVRFKAYKKGNFLGEIKLGVAGRHNISNALACLVAAMECGLGFDKISEAFKGFVGVNRRFQTVGSYNDARLVDDYAHHPTEIEATVKTAKELVKQNKKGNVVAVFQPHRYSRLANLWDDFANSFKEADSVFIIDVFSAGEEPVEGVNSEEFAKVVKNDNVQYIGGDLDKVAEVLRNKIENCDIVLTMGAGSITRLGKMIEGKDQVIF